MEPQSIRYQDPQIYGIDWNADDSQVGSSKSPRVKEKPFCELEGCSNRVSTEFNRPKPYCTEHIKESPYVQEIIRLWAEIDPKEDRKRANIAFKKLKATL